MDSIIIYVTFFYFLVLYSRFYSGSSAINQCTMFADRAVIKRRNVYTDVKSAYRGNKDFLSVVLKSRVIAAALNVLGLENKTGRPS